jgi:23S rRNA (cytosine1962-C5)-methyltransferase
MEGDVVDVVDNHNSFLCKAHFHNGSIALRVLTLSDETIDTKFWSRKIQAAYEYRNTLGLNHSEQTNMYRVINAEGDGFPGLVVDRYNRCLVMQIHTTGFWNFRHELTELLEQILETPVDTIYNKSANTLPGYIGETEKNEHLKGSRIATEAGEYGLNFDIDFTEGQKTGFFIDQRENRKLLEYYAKNRSVLNMFCYSGAFSVYALRGGARLVHSVDASAKAMKLTDRNIASNFPNASNHKSFVADAFDFFKDANEEYDLIVLDPPAFAKHKNALHNAQQGYKRINQKALEVIRSGGILFTFSCSQVISKDMFRKSVFAAAANAGRSVRIMHQLTQPPDHPVSIYHPEGEYLKGLVLYVE